MVDELFDGAGVYRRNFLRANVLEAEVRDLAGGVVGSPSRAGAEKLRAELGTADVLLAGPPCQGHSGLANLQTPWPRNDLYVRVERAAVVIRPEVVPVERADDPARPRILGAGGHRGPERAGPAGVGWKRAMASLICRLRERRASWRSCLRPACVVVSPADAVAVADLGDRGYVDGVVESAVPARRQPADRELVGGHLDRRRAVVGGEVVPVWEARCPGGVTAGHWGGGARPG